MKNYKYLETTLHQPTENTPESINNNIVKKINQTVKKWILKVHYKRDFKRMSSKCTINHVNALQNDYKMITFIQNKFVNQ